MPLVKKAQVGFDTVTKLFKIGIDGEGRWLDFPDGSPKSDSQFDDSWPMYGGRYGNNFSPDKLLSPTQIAISLSNLTSFSGGGGIIIGQPVVSERIVYFGDGSGYLNAYLRDGSSVWQQFLSDAPSEGGIGGILSTPAVVDVQFPQSGGTTKIIIVGAGGDDDTDQAYVFALNAWTGALLWQTPVSAPPGNHIFSSPAVFDDSVFIGVSSLDDGPLIQGLVVKLNVITGEITATFKVVPDGSTGGGVWGSATISEDEGVLYVATGNEGDGPGQDYTISLLSLSLKDLTIVDSWRNVSGINNDEDFGSTPTLFETTSGTKLVGIGSKDGNYYVFNRNDLASGPIATLQFGSGGGNPYFGVIAPASYNGIALFVAGPGELSYATLTTTLSANANLLFTAKTAGVSGRYQITYEEGGETTEASVVDGGILVVLEGIDQIQASATTALSGSNNDLVLTSGTNFPGASGNGVTVSIRSDGSPGHGIGFEFGTGPTDFHINHDTDATAQDVLDYFVAHPTPYLTVALAPGNDGSGVLGTDPDVMSTLADGIDGETVATADDVLAAIQADESSDNLVTVEHAPGNDGSGIVGAFSGTLSGGSFGVIRAFDPDDLDGGPIWEQPLGGYAIAPVLSTPYLVMVASDGLQILNASDGSLITTLGSDQLNGGPSLADHFLYQGDNTSSVYVYSIS